MAALAVVRDLREHWAPASAGELERFETVRRCGVAGGEVHRGVDAQGDLVAVEDVEHAEDVPVPLSPGRAYVSSSQNFATACAEGAAAASGHPGSPASLPCRGLSARRRNITAGHPPSDLLGPTGPIPALAGGVSETLTPPARGCRCRSASPSHAQDAIPAANCEPEDQSADARADAEQLRAAAVQFIRTGQPGRFPARW